MGILWNSWFLKIVLLGILNASLYAKIPIGKNLIDSYYKTIELPSGSSIDDIRKSCRSLRAKYHPDRNKKIL